MKQIATGIQTTGTPHLGNILGAIMPTIEMGAKSERPPVHIVADMHSMISVRDPAARERDTNRVAAAWLAFGASEDGILYRQSRISALSEIAFLLSGTANLNVVMEEGPQETVFNSIHPVLMSADLLMIEASHVPVGQDSAGHMAIVRDTARRFNEVYGNILSLPEPLIDLDRPTIRGADGEKMSKSRGNTIDVLCAAEEIRAQLAGLSDHGIQMISEDVTACLEGRSRGMSAEDLTELLVERFKVERDEFARLLSTTRHLEKLLERGESQVRLQATLTRNRMLEAMGMM